MNGNAKRVIGVIVTALLLILMIRFASDALGRKESKIKNNDFFLQKEDFDVLFLGTSHMINGVYPLELWDDYGIVSYNLASHGAPIATTYWVLKNALDYTTPKLVVLDCYSAMGGEKVSSEFQLMHAAFDSFKLSKNKIKAVNDLLEYHSNSDKISILWNLSTYHNRWNQLEDWDYNTKFNNEKGAETRIGLEAPAQFDSQEYEVVLEPNTCSCYYIRKIIQECNISGIEVLLTYIPFPMKPERIAEAEMIVDLAAEEGVNYLDLTQERIVNLYTDMFDSDSHLNPSGAKKVTYRIGEYIKDNYQIPDERTNAKYSNWITDYEDYLQNKKFDYMFETSPYIYMTLIADRDYCIEQEIYSEEIYLDEEFALLIDNINYTKINKCDNPYDFDVDMRLIIKDAKTDEVIERSLFNYSLDDNGSGTIELSRDYYGNF